MYRKFLLVACIIASTLVACASRQGRLDSYQLVYPIADPTQPALAYTRYKMEFQSNWGKGWVVNGKPVKAFDALIGLRDDRGQVIIPAESDELVAEWPLVAYARRHGDKTFTRYWLDGSGKKEPTDIQQIRRFRGPRFYGIVGTLNMGNPLLGDIPPNTPVTAVVFADDGQELFRLPRVVRADAGARSTTSIASEAWPVDSIPGGFIAHHVDSDNAPFDLIYDGRGSPLSPPLPRLFKLPVGLFGRVHFFAVKSNFMWPINQIGEPATLPASVDGLLPLVSRVNHDLVDPRTDRLVGWLVHHQDGERQWWTVADDLARLRANESGLGGIEFESVQPIEQSGRVWPHGLGVWFHPRFAARRVGQTQFEGFALVPEQTADGKDGRQRLISTTAALASTAEVWNQVGLGVAQFRQNLDRIATDGRVASATASVDRDSPTLSGPEREAAIARKTKEIEFSGLEALGFPEPKSYPIAASLGGDHLGRWCLKRCKDHIMVRQAMSTLPFGSNLLEPLGAIYSALSPAPPPTPIALPRFRIGDLGGDRLPQDRSFQNYRSGWQNWYYQNGQLVIQPSGRK